MGNRLTILFVALSVVVLSGCSGTDDLLAYLGGGLPPGDEDIGGVVVASVTSAATSAASVVTAAGTIAVPGARVVLSVGAREVGETITGDGGYFRFERPRTGQYIVTVTPPTGTGLQQARREFRHQAGRQTFLTIVLEPAP